MIQPKDVIIFPEIHAFASYKTAKKFVKKFFGDEAYYNPNPACAGNCTVYSCGQDIVAVIIVNKKYWSKDNPTFIYSTIVHECMHCVRSYYEVIGETSTGRESEAYLMESVFTSTLKQLQKHIDKFQK